MNSETLKEYKLLLFGKDVYSIIESYNPEGFHVWDQQTKNVIGEYHEKLIWVENKYCGMIISKKSTTDDAFDKLFQTREFIHRINLIWHTNLHDNIPRSIKTHYYTKYY